MSHLTVNMVWWEMHPLCRSWEACTEY